MAINRLEIDRLEGLWKDARVSHSVEDNTAEAKLSVWADKIEQLVASHPRTLVIAALAAGITLGWLGKRK